MAIQKWHYGKLVILWSWGVALAGFSFHLLESVENPTFGFILIAMSIGIPVVMSAVTWRWLTGKEGCRSQIQANADRLKVGDLLEDVARFVATKLPGSQQHAGICSYTFTLADATESHERAIVDVCLNDSTPRHVFLQFHKRAADMAGSLLESFGMSHQELMHEDRQFQTVAVEIAPDQWPKIALQLAPAFLLILDRMEASAGRSESI